MLQIGVTKFIWNLQKMLLKEAFNKGSSGDTKAMVAFVFDVECSKLNKMSKMSFFEMVAFCEAQEEQIPQVRQFSLIRIWHSSQSEKFHIGQEEIDKCLDGKVEPRQKLIAYLLEKDLVRQSHYFDFKTTSLSERSINLTILRMVRRWRLITQHLNQSPHRMGKVST